VSISLQYKNNDVFIYHDNSNNKQCENNKSVTYKITTLLDSQCCNFVTTMTN